MCNTRCPLDDGYDGRGYWPGLSAILSSATGNTQEMQWSEISFLVYQQSSNEVRIRKKSHQNISILFSVYLKWFIYRYLKTNINCGNAGTNVLHFTPVKNITHRICTCVSFCLFTRCTMNLHCSCEWLHALENVYLEPERLAKVRKSNIFEQCTGTLKEDCGEFIRHLIQLYKL